MGYSLGSYSLDMLPIESTINLSSKLSQFRIDINFTLTIIDSLIENSTGELNYIYTIIKNIIGKISSKIDYAYSVGATGQEEIGDIEGIKELIQQYSENLNKAKSITKKGELPLFGIAAFVGVAALLYFYFK